MDLWILELDWRVLCVVVFHCMAVSAELDWIFDWRVLDVHCLAVSAADLNWNWRVLDVHCLAVSAADWNH